MKLVRVAIIYFTPAPDGWDSWSLKLGKVVVQTIPIGKAPPVTNAKRLLVKAEVELTAHPPVGSDGLLDIPEGERRACEHALETAANLVAVMTRTSRRITSAWPPVAFVPESDDSRHYLERTQGIRYQHSGSVGARSAIVINDDVVSALADRLDGLASVADFFCTDHALSRYREAARFFEIAFALPISAMEKKLAQFLSSGPFGYTRDEISSWLLHRHGAMHGDTMKTASFTWESDVRRFMHRIEQALLDVLLNKTGWHTNSKSRRAVWAPAFGTPSVTGDIFATVGVGGSVEFQMLDAWEAFPLDLSSLDSPPSEWWCKIVETPCGSQ